MVTQLFLYGTLHPDRAPQEIAETSRRLKSIAKGTVRGHLHGLGDYPGLVLDDNGDAVHGEIFEVPDGHTLAELDAYEGFHVSDPGSSLFLRTHAAVTLSDGSKRACWVYVYNRGIEQPAPPPA
jgi:gamma-glutamylcyclotransferase (GGCT)/AIG2-like uncharacterized protein YtfP